MSQKVSVYSTQKMTFLDGCTQLCTQLAENWGMVVFGQKIRKVRSFSTQKMLRLLTFYNLFLIEILFLFFVTDVLFNPKKNLWLYSLTNKLENKEAIRMLLEDYKGKQYDNLYTAVMQVVMKANGERMKYGM